jgi:serine/threonine-protein kinase RsbW
MQRVLHTLRFASQRNAFERASAEMRLVLEDAGLCGSARGHAELVFEEVVSNIIRHASASWLDVSVSSGDGSLVLAFEDDGAAFDPLTHPDPVLPDRLEEANVGGLGLFLVRKVAAALQYERTRDARNRLVVTIAVT